jgi:decaprenylphospho-beta-D-erythro-pentofuranosid-2-ulose 2-reductase
MTSTEGSRRKTVLVLGGSSDIGRSAARVFAENGWLIRLAGRSLDGLRREADDIAARTGAPVTVHAFDALDAGRFASFVDGLPELPDVVVCVVGLLGNQERAESDLDHASLVMRSNYEGPALILGLFANRFLKRGFGIIVGVSSVAGDRGRASNYVYGSAKAGLTAFLSGLRNRCAPGGVRVVTVKPGFVRTRMTEGMALPPRLTAEPRAIGEGIYRATGAGADVVYLPRIWGLVMLIIRTIPEAAFKRMKI